MKKNITTALVLSLSLSACGGSSDSNNNDDIDTDTDVSCTVDCDTDTDTTENLGAQILDTLTDDVGELRIGLNDIAAGTLTASVQLQEDENTTVTDDGVTSIKSTGYITLSNDGNEVAEIILSSGDVKYRASEDAQITIEGLTYNEGDELDIYVEWDESSYSFSLDGGTTMQGPYIATAHDGTSNPVVDRLSFRLADTTSWSQHELNVDNIVVTDDATEVVSESFPIDTYSVGDDLLDYYSSGSEVTVQTMDFSASDNETEPETGDNYVANIIDTSLSADGELRIAVDETASGSVSATIQLQADADTEMPSDDNTEGTNNTAYLTIYGGSASADNVVGEISFTSGGVTKYRDSDKVQQEITGLSYSEDTPLDVQVSWDDSEYYVSLDGGETNYGPYIATNTGAVVSTIQFHIGSGDKQATNEMIVDDIVVVDDEGEQVLSEDFDTGYAENEDLSSTYNNSAEAEAQILTL